MQKKDKTYLTVFFLCITLSIVLSFYDFVIRNNFKIYYSKGNIPSNKEIIIGGIKF